MNLERLPNQKIYITLPFYEGYGFITSSRIEGVYSKKKNIKYCVTADNGDNYILYRKFIKTIPELRQEKIRDIIKD